jgi:hypothetical protein
MRFVDLKTLARLVIPAKPVCAKPVVSSHAEQWLGRATWAQNLTSKLRVAGSSPAAPATQSTARSVNSAWPAPRLLDTLSVTGPASTPAGSR